jgi:hypothetical protein
MTVNSEHHPNGRGIIRRLVSRVRSGSDGYKHHPTDDINFHDVDQLPSSFNGEPQQGRKSSSSSIHSTSAPSGHGFFRPPTFRSTHSTTSNAADGGEKRGLAYRYRRAARSRSRSTTPTRRGNKGRDAELKLSRDLWDDAYDSLRLDPSTCSLVTTYEAIIAQELPDEHKLAAHGALTNAEGDADRRADLMAEIVRAGLLKRRGSKTSQVQDAARLVLQHSKQAVQDAWELNPAAAVAWAGLCTLTPVSLGCRKRK